LRYNGKFGTLVKYLCRIIEGGGRGGRGRGREREREKKRKERN